MNPFRYRIVVEWSDEDRRFLARVPALPGCLAHGKTEGTAAHQAREAAEAMLAVLKEDGDALPPPDTTADYSGQTRLRIPRSLHERLARDASAEGVSLNTLLLTALSAAHTHAMSKRTGDDVDESAASSEPSESTDRPVRAPRASAKKTPQRKSA